MKTVEKAFEEAGLTPLNKMMEKQFIFVRKQFMEDHQETAWLGDEVLYMVITEAFQKTSTADVTPVNGYNGNYYVALRNNSFNGSVDTPRRVIVHAIMHAGRAEGRNDPVPNIVYFPPDRVGSVMTPGGYGKVGYRKPKHDLEWMNFSGDSYTGVYEKILRTCAPED